ncbi:hypothetical protein LVJ94_20860 [Pendulispora rubella]|uniref:Uncharacterized protein n=1 Tax=Pendulispora rubella TaxID=2741070 RepID=A0ABZ2LFF9_9BACT
MNLRLVTRAPGFATGSIGNLAISFWESQQTAEQAHHAAEVLSALGRTEGRVLVLAVLPPTAPAPSNAVRSVISNAFTRLGSQIHAVANAVEGDGFRAATMRAVVTSMALVIRPSYPVKTVATVEDAAEFLAAHSDGRLTVSDIVLASRELRS